MTTNKEDIRRWLDLYMEGKTSLEEEALLTEYFRSPDADKDFADFKTMFDQFDEGEPSFTEEEQERWMQSCPLEEIPGSSALQTVPPMLPKRIRRTRQIAVRWIAAASVAAACFFLGTTVSRKEATQPTNSIPMPPTILTEVKWKTDTVFIEKPVPTALTAKIITVRDTIVLPASHPKGRMTGAQFWVQYWFEDHEDYEEHRPKITEIFDLLDATPFLHKHTEETDSGDIMRKTYAMSLRSDIQGQQDFLKLEASPTGVFFYYQTTNRFAQAENDAIPDQAIIAELEKLFNQYVSRRKTVKQEVHFHGAYGRVVHNKGYNNDPTAFSEGCRYIIPKCTRADYQLFYDLFHKYLKKDVVYVASNDVYWEYEETGIRIRQADGRPLYMGAAWKNDKLYLIRLEGSHNGNGVFPRAWAEDNPIWDSSYITKKLQKNKQANQK